MDIEDALVEHADTAAYVAEILYGDAYEIFKSALSAEEKKVRRELLQTRLSQASNVVGLAAGLSAMPGAVKDTKQAYREYKKIPEDQRPKRMKLSPKSFVPKSKGGKIALGVAGGNLALQGLNLAGDGLTGLVLNRAAKKTAKEVKKSDRDEFGVYCEISKVDTDKRQVFGWASISKKHGAEVVEDLQGDSIDTDELEKAAYNYMLKSRKGGHEHQKGDEGPVHVSDIIESMVITKEKKEALGLPEDMHEGWWVGFKVNDDKVWELAKSGELAGFSIHGSGRRVPT